MKAVFNFYKDNRMDGHYTLTAKELTEKFDAWLKVQEIKWLEHYLPSTVVAAFVWSDNEFALDSTLDDNEAEELVKLLAPVRRCFLDKQQEPMQ